MRSVIYFIVIAIVAVVALAAYVRLAPTDATRWHVPIAGTEDADLAGGAIRVVPGDAALMTRVDAVMRALPRTRVLDGALEDGRITYVTRSALWGFPDYTTLELDAGVLKMFARLRFGRSDLGVNAARLTAVLAAAQG